MDSSLEIIKSEIEKRHQGDVKQLAVVFDTNNRLLVEAPAGYGKTNTMVTLGKENRLFGVDSFAEAGKYP